MFKKFTDLGFFYSLVFIAISFPLPYKISNLGILFLIIFWLIQQILGKVKFKFCFKGKYDKGVFYSFLVFFLWNGLSLLYTDDINNGFKMLEGKLSLFILPIIFYSSTVTKESTIKLIRYYVYSITICTLFLLALSIHHYSQFGNFLTYHDFTKALGFHAVFYSYYIFLAIISAVYLLGKKQLNKPEKVLFVISIGLSFVGLLISASKNVMVVTTVLVLIGMITRGIKYKFGLKELFVFVFFFGIAIFSVSKIPTIKNRISELVQLNGIENLDKIKKGEMIVEEDIPKFNGTSLRITFWYVGIKVLTEQNRLLIGLSPGDRREVINQEHYKNGLNPWYENYNLHNQFIQTLIELGIIGLIIYLILHLIMLLCALHERNLLLTTFISGLIFFQMTESLIERNKGIVFFCFFLLLLKQLSPTDEDRYIRN